MQCIKIRIKCENTEISKKDKLPLKAGKYVIISISDKGTGIPKEHLASIFDPFYTTKQTGNGLGLATAYSITKKHKGHITVSSKPDKGSTFSIYLPASKNGIKEKLDPKLSPKQKSERILIMDDEKMILEISSTMISSLG